MILALYGSQKSGDQQRAFTAAPKNGRKVIFATNIAETSLTIDGVKIWLDGGWVLLRPSNTQPVIRMFVEATDQNKLDEIKNEFKNYFDKSVEKFLD